MENLLKELKEAKKSKISSWIDEVSRKIDMRDKLKEAKAKWELLGDVPVNNKEEIDEKFLDFEKGTCIYEIWTWFEETFNVSVAKDLMNLK